MTSFKSASASIIGASLLLAGCAAVGPNYKAPNLAPPVAFKHADPKVSPLPPAPNWWAVFADPRLDALENEALAHNPSIAQAAANLAAARAQLGVARADRQPTVSLAATTQFAGETATQYIPISGRSVSYRISGDSYDVPINASYELDLWGRVRREVEGAQASYQASEADLHGAELSLTASVAQAYYQWRTAVVQVDIARRTVASRRDSLTVLSSRNQSGLTDGLDVASAREQLADAEDSLAQLEQTREQDENALAILTGRAPSDFTAPNAADNSGSLALPVPPPIPAGLPSDLLRRRPDLVSAERSLASQSAQIGVAIAAKYPAIRLTGEGGFDSLDLKTLFSGAASLWNLGSSISLPILDGGKNNANIAAARAHADAALAAYRQQTLTALREVEDNLVALRREAGRAEAEGRAVTAARETVYLSRIRYEKGLINYLNVADAERDLFVAENTTAVLAGARCLSTIALIQAMGGGWN